MAQDLRLMLSDEEFINTVPRRFPAIDFSNTLDLYKSDRSDLPRQQFGWAFMILLIAVVPPALLYGLGLVVAWVKAGFKLPPGQ